jgi:hypothetical protein
MKPKKRNRVSVPVLLLAIIVIGYIVLKYAVPYTLTQLLAYAQRDDKTKFENEIKRLQPSLDQLSCSLKSSSFVPNVDASPYLSQKYFCQSYNASKTESILADAGLLKADPKTKIAYPLGTYTLQYGTLHDVISVGDRELNVTISQ